MTCCQQWKSDGTWVYFGSVSADYRNPVQGGIWLDCTFLAALTSMTWTTPASVSAQNAQGILTYNFYDGGATIPVKINNNLLVVDPNASPQTFCGAVSNQFSTTKEIWPALYEKAYAKFCLYKKGLITLANLNNAAYWPLYDAAGQYDNRYNPCSLTDVEWGGNPLTVLGYLTGCPTQSQRIYPKDGNGMPIRTSPNNLYCAALVKTYKDADYNDGSYIYQFIKDCFCNNVGWVNKTKKPMVAWTYKDNTYLPAGKSFLSTGIQANHSYAILGTYQLTISGTKHYFVVLRDPCGIDPSSTAISKATGTYKYFNGIADFCNKGIILMAVQGVQTPLALAEQDGVFGLEAYELKTYFESFGWIP